MSGPESNPEQPEPRDNGRPLSPEAADLGPSTLYASTSPPAGVRQPEPDEPELDEDAEHEPSKPKPWALLVAKLSAIRFPKISWPFGFPSLGSERHEVLPPLGHEPTSAPTLGAAEPEPEPEPAPPTSAIGRLAARLPAISLKRETRIGLAAVVTFVFLVTGLAAKKGWLGDLGLPLMALNSHSQEDAAGATKPDAAASSGHQERARDKDKAGDPAKLKVETLPAPLAPKSPLIKDNADQHPPDAAPPTPPSSHSKLAEPDHLAGPEIIAPGVAPEPASSPPALPEPSLPPPGDSPPLNLPGDKVEATPAAAEPTIPSMPPVAGDNPPPSTPAAEPEPSLPLPTMPGDPLAAMPSIPAPTPAPTPAPVNPPPVATPPPAVVVVPPAAAEPPPMARAVEPSPTERPPTLEQVPSPSQPGGPDPMAAAIPSGTATAASIPTSEPGWVVIPRGGKRPRPGIAAPGGLAVISEPLKVPDGPAAPADQAAADQVEPVLHRVRSGENFFTISKLYYNSGRYYKALHSANARQVPAITDLAVGDVIRVPPPEALDRSLILPPGRPVASGPIQASADRAASTVSRDSRPAASPDEVPVAAARRPRVVRPDPEARDEPFRPTYRVKGYDTLRSIARDTLGDPHRAQDILNLNRDAIDDPATLRAGALLTLPEDAIVGRRGR